MVFAGTKSASNFHLDVLQQLAGTVLCICRKLVLWHGEVSGFKFRVKGSASRQRLGDSELRRHFTCAHTKNGTDSMVALSSSSPIASMMALCLIVPSTEDTAWSLTDLLTSTSMPMAESELAECSSQKRTDARCCG